jgi:hypothetical protein
MNSRSRRGERICRRMTFGVANPSANLVLLLDVGVNGLWGKIVFSHNERKENRRQKIVSKGYKYGRRAFPLK